MTWKRIAPIAAVAGAVTAGIAVVLRRRRSAGAGGTPSDGVREYEVVDGVVDLTSAADEDGVPDVLKGVVDVPQTT